MGGGRLTHLSCVRDELFWLGPYTAFATSGYVVRVRTRQTGGRAHYTGGSNG